MSYSVPSILQWTTRWKNTTSLRGRRRKIQKLLPPLGTSITPVRLVYAAGNTVLVRLVPSSFCSSPFTIHLLHLWQTIHCHTLLFLNRLASIPNQEVEVSTFRTSLKLCCWSLIESSTNVRIAFRAISTKLGWSATSVKNVWTCNQNNRLSLMVTLRLAPTIFG